jgi:beta-lactamase class A
VRASTVAERLAGIQGRIGGRLGVHAYDTQTARRIGFNDTDRFAMASTFKLMLAASVLSRVDRGSLTLEQRIAFGKGDLLPHAPVTAKHVAQGSLSIRELCAAVVEESDNPAANMLLRQIGGPPQLTQFMRSLGDEATRLDRMEMELNTNLPGDPRDTTTPRAMVASMEQVLLKSALSDASRNLLIGWLIGSRTGLQRIRAGLPAGWKAGDKTGTGANGAVNDLAIVWPPDRKPILLALYLSESRLGTEALSAAHAEVASLLVPELVGQE